MDFSKVLWSSFRDTDKIFHIERFTLTVPANNTYGEFKTFGPMVYGERQNNENVMVGFRPYIYYRPSGQDTWLPASNILGSTYLSPSGVGVGISSAFGGAMEVFAFAYASSGSDRSVDVVCMAGPVKESDVSVFGRALKYITAGRKILSNTDTGKIKWSSFDKQATVVDSKTIVYAATGSPYRIATIPHNQTSRPMVKTQAFYIAFNPPNSFSTTPTFDYVRVWKDNVNIYVEYEPPSGTFPSGDMLLEVWWYYV